jgi:hypothetical protein
MAAGSERNHRSLQLFIHGEVEANFAAIFLNQKIFLPIRAICFSTKSCADAAASREIQFEQSIQFV